MTHDRCRVNHKTLEVVYRKWTSKSMGGGKGKNDNFAKSM